MSYDDEGYDDYYADDDEYGDEWACTHCGGEQLVECDDPFQCCRPHIGEWCTCGACNGTGLRKHQRVF